MARPAYSGFSIEELMEDGVIPSVDYQDIPPSLSAREAQNLMTLSRDKTQYQFPEGTNRYILVNNSLLSIALGRDWTKRLGNIAFPLVYADKGEFFTNLRLNGEDGLEKIAGKTATEIDPELVLADHINKMPERDPTQLVESEPLKNEFDTAFYDAQPDASPLPAAEQRLDPNLKLPTHPQTRFRIPVPHHPLHIAPGEQLMSLPEGKIKSARTLKQPLQTEPVIALETGKPPIVPTQPQAQPSLIAPAPGPNDPITSEEAEILLGLVKRFDGPNNQVFVPRKHIRDNLGREDGFRRLKNDNLIDPAAPREDDYVCLNYAELLRRAGREIPESLTTTRTTKARETRVTQDEAVALLAGKRGVNEARNWVLIPRDHVKRVLGSGAFTKLGDSELYIEGAPREDDVVHLNYSRLLTRAGQEIPSPLSTLTTTSPNVKMSTNGHHAGSPNKDVGMLPSSAPIIERRARSGDLTKRTLEKLIRFGKEHPGTVSVTPAGANNSFCLSLAPTALQKVIGEGWEAALAGRPELNCDAETIPGRILLDAERIKEMMGLPRTTNLSDVVTGRVKLGNNR